MTDSATYYYATDPTGSVIGLAEFDGAARVVNHYRYDVWGMPQGNETEGAENPIRFKARWWDPDTELLDFRSRWYDPEIGRFISEHPSGLAGRVNLYQYVGNNPASYTDPFGLMADTVSVACRDSKVPALGHCAVRVHNEDVDLTVELLPSVECGNAPIAGVCPLVNRFTGSNPGDAAFEAYNNWTQVAVPDGMTSAQFDAAVLGGIGASVAAMAGHVYNARGQSNSNSFVHRAVTNAGGQIPQAATRGFIAVPGLCGGRGLLTGRC